jgi:hypothetical protein
VTVTVTTVGEGLTIARNCRGRTPIITNTFSTELENLMFEINNTETHDILELDESLGAMAMGVHCGDDDDED